MKAICLAITTSTLLLTSPFANSKTIENTCREYVRAIQAVERARNNNDTPSWKQLKKMHPIINRRKDDSNLSAASFAALITMGMATADGFTVETCIENNSDWFGSVTQGNPH